MSGGLLREGTTMCTRMSGGLLRERYYHVYKDVWGAPEGEVYYHVYKDVWGAAEGEVLPCVQGCLGGC